MKMSNEPIGKDCNGVDLFVGDYAKYENAFYIITGYKTDERYKPTRICPIGKRILSTKFKPIKKPKDVTFQITGWLYKITKQDVIESFKKIYLDWDETMKNIDTAFERNI